MPIGLKEKQAIVAEVNETAKVALSAVMADYRGVSVDAMTSLRATARTAGVQVRVIRNTLAKRAFEGTEFECMNEALLGPCVLAFALDDPGASARVFKDFAKENDAFEIKALSVGGELAGCRPNRCFGEVADSRRSFVTADGCDASTGD